MAIVGALLISGLSISCDDEKKMVCCWCECLLQMGDGVDLKTKTVSGEGISCKSACTQECQREARWQLDNYANVDCSQMPDTATN
jgi:hypothetical protein